MQDVDPTETVVETRQADADPEALERAHVDRIADEFFDGFDAVADVAHPAVSVFGSARIAAGHPDYAAARDIGEARGCRFSRARTHRRANSSATADRALRT